MEECLHAVEALARTRAGATRLVDSDVLPLLCRVLGEQWVMQVGLHG